MPEALKLVVTARQIAKMGLNPDQCEDAWAVAPSTDRFAVADGASDSYASGRFARLLVEGFVSESGPRSGPDFLPWARRLADVWSEATPLAGLPWYKQEKARLGAHCTFVGVQIESSETSPPHQTSDSGEQSHESEDSCDSSQAIRPAVPAFAYRAFAVGDACLFHVRQDRLLRCFPIERPEDFGVQPALIATSRAYGGPGLDRLSESRGVLVAGDLLILATDAVAHYILAAAGEGERPWWALAERSNDEFGALVARQRSASHMRNDDATLVAVLAVTSEPALESAPAPDKPPAVVTTSAHGRRRGNRRRDRALAVSIGVGALLIAAALVRGSRPTSSLFDVAGNGPEWP